jgi:hypothetical protein
MSEGRWSEEGKGRMGRNEQFLVWLDRVGIGRATLGWRQDRLVIWVYCHRKHL